MKPAVAEKTATNIAASRSHKLAFFMDAARGTPTLNSSSSVHGRGGSAAAARGSEALKLKAASTKVRISSSDALRRSPVFFSAFNHSNGVTGDAKLPVMCG